MADQFIQRVAAKALIVNTHGNVLILREASTYDEGTNVGRYGLPGGRLNPGEPFFEALRREVMEEAGLEVDVLGPVHVDEWFPEIKGAKNHIVGMFIWCRPRTTVVVLSEEHDDHRWIAPIEVENFDLMSAEASAIRAWSQQLQR